MSLETRSEQDGVAILALDRPPANAMDVSLLQEVTQRSRDRRDTAAGARHHRARGFFSAGADLKRCRPTAPSEQRAAVQGIIDMALGVYALPCPVVGAITATRSRAAWCSRSAPTARRLDRRPVRPDRGQGRRPLPRAAIGVVQAELSPSAAGLLALGNQLVDAEPALRLGAFDEACEPERVLPRRSRSPPSSRRCRRACTHARRHELRGVTIAELTASRARRAAARALGGLTAVEILQKIAGKRPNLRPDAGPSGHGVTV